MRIFYECARLVDRPLPTRSATSAHTHTHTHTQSAPGRPINKRDQLGRRAPCLSPGRARKQGLSRTCQIHQAPQKFHRKREGEDKALPRPSLKQMGPSRIIEPPCLSLCLSESTARKTQGKNGGVGGGGTRCKKVCVSTRKPRKRNYQSHNNVGEILLAAKRLQGVIYLMLCVFFSLISLSLMGLLHPPDCLSQKNILGRIEPYWFALICAYSIMISNCVW